MSSDKHSRDVAQITNIVLDLMDSINPMFEAGTGLKAKLESEGWSPSVAEHIAMTVVIEMITKALNS